MNHNLRKALEANRFYYAALFDAMRPAHEKIQIEQKHILSRLYHESAEIAMRLQALEEAEFGHKYNPDEPRIPAGSGQTSGDWTGGDGGNAEGVTAADRRNPRFKGMTPTQIKKQKFVDAHLAAAEKGAQQLNVPVGNILGLSGLESSWGLSRFAKEGNNFFGQHSPQPYETGSFPTNNPKVRGSIFDSYDDSLQSFIDKRGSIIQGVSDPSEFVKVLQDSGAYGINTTYMNGRAIYSPKPGYVSDVVSTIKGLSPYVARAREQ